MILAQVDSWHRSERVKPKLFLCGRVLLRNLPTNPLNKREITKMKIARPAAEIQCIDYLQQGLHIHLLDLCGNMSA